MPGEGYIFETYFRGVAQHGSVLEWGSSGRWFESSRPDYEIALKSLFYEGFREFYFWESFTAGVLAISCQQAFVRRSSEVLYAVNR
jgi:hypothetical protein